MNRILLIVFDGLQPAQITPDLMPNLSRLASEGVTFSNHHAVFPTVTRANVASIVTGHLPGAHGLTANTLVIPEYDPHRPFSALEPVLTEVASKTSVLLKSTLADILHHHGHEYVAVGAGTSGNAYLQNPSAETGGGATIHPDFTLPRALNGEIASRFGPWPDQRGPSGPKMAQVVDVVTRYVLAERQPAVAMMWLSEPDVTQHAHGVGSEQAVAAIKDADASFGSVLNWLDANGLASGTNVIVASDHGYSTVQEVIEVEALVHAAGFPPANETDGVAVAANGGAVLFYVPNASTSTIRRLAEFLTAQPWCGALLASEAAGDVPGTLPAGLIGLEGPRAPALVMSFRWDSRRNSAGYAGHAYSSSLGPGRGQHGSMSKHETHNVLFASGPDFKNSTSIDSPTGNVDISPTILHILGLPGGDSMHGRVLHEALAGGPDAVEWEDVVHRAECTTRRGKFSQEMSTSRVGKTVYVNYGSGGLQSC